MKSVSAAILCGTCVVAHPIEDVIGMLKDLATKAEEEGKEEALAFQKFEYWCKNSVKSLNKAIAEENDNIDALSSKIEAKTKERDALAKQIAELADQLGKFAASATKAKNQRDDENALYTKARDDTQSTIDAVDQCITALKDAKSDVSFAQAQQKVAGAMALLQLHLSEHEHSVLKEFTDPSDIMAMGDRAGHVKKYSFKGGNVIELLKNLKLKFEDDLTQIEKEETNAQNSYDLAKKARDNAIDAAEDSKEEKEDLKGEVESELNEAENDLSNEKEELEADSGTLDATKKSCSVKSSEWEERSTIRTNEIEAIHQAVKILAKVGDVRTEAPDNAGAPPSPVSFIQLDGSSNDPKMKAVVYLRQQAKVLHAKALDRLAQQVAAHLGDPFAQVTNMIEQMIFRLMAEQKDEDDHKNWCDKEIAKTEKSIEDKEDKVEELSAKIEDAEGTIAELTEDIKDAQEKIAEIVSFMSEATDIRKEGKKENQLAMKDAQDAQTAIANAVAVLTDFYKSSGEIAKEPWEFIQRGVDLPDSPDTWDSSYTGVADPKAQPGGIVTVLEKTSEDFAKMEADTRAQEASDQEAYEADMQENDIEKAKRTKESEMKSNEKKRLVDKVAAMTKTKKHVSDELEATEQYEKDLQPACVEGDSSYEDRKAARTQEIEALRTAQNILADAFKDKDGFLQKRAISRA
jgi:peptidoglycan hydrolase CwlO-like protein